MSEHVSTDPVAPTAADNPLLDFSGLPAWDRIRAEHVAPAIERLLIESEAALAAVTAPGFPADWQAVSATLDTAGERLSRAWGAVGHLKSVMDTPAIRAAYNDMLPKVTEFYTRLGSDEKLYAVYKAIDPTTLSAAQKQARANAIRNFVLGGAELRDAAKERFTGIQERQAELSQKFSENALDATEAFAHYATADEIAGIPPDVVAAARAAAAADGRDSHYKFTLKMPSYLPVLQFAEDRELRRVMHRANSVRASELADGDATRFDNTATIAEILRLRQEEAQLLGYANFAEVSLAAKMADSPAQVVAFLRDLGVRARPHAERDVADMRAFAKDTLGIDDPQPWDWAFVGEKLKESRYAFSEQAVKEYFTAPKVLEGLFKIVETLFEVTIRRDDAPVWTDGVEFYRIERAGGGDAAPELVGQFYLDPAARDGKRGGAWMDDVRDRWKRPDDGRVQTPVAHLVCNFGGGVDGKPPLLTHDDVITLFHEFGHGIHQMLTRVEERDVSGINGVEWDAVELPSQFMENFCWEWSVVRHMTAHVDTGEPLPRELFDKMLAAKNFQSGLGTLRQVQFSLVDMLLHSEAGAAADAQGVADRVAREVLVIPQPEYSRTLNAFSHIFAGGYAAGYYSYKWAEVLSADAYAAFEETAGEDGTPSVATGRRYREAILEAGGSRPAMESFKAFRGREPSIDALLRHQGMTAAA